MIGILTLHVVALLCWSAALLVLLGVLCSTAGKVRPATRLALVLRDQESLARTLYTRIASPLSVITILSGTAVFLLNKTTEPWLIVKLTFVTVLVATHCLTGLLVVRNEQRRSTKAGAWLLAVQACSAILIIFWLVLAKPGGLELRRTTTSVVATASTYVTYVSLQALPRHAAPWQIKFKPAPLVGHGGEL